MNTFQIIFLLGVLFGAAQAADALLEDHAVYQILAKEGNGSLTVTNTTGSDHAPVSVEEWTGHSGQKWRVWKSFIHRAFEFNPILNENFALEVDPEGNVIQRFFKKTWSWGNNRLWRVIDVGQGFNRIRNWHYDLCLQTTGLGSNVTAVECKDESAQQWIVKKL